MSLFFVQTLFRTEINCNALLLFSLYLKASCAISIAILRLMRDMPEPNFIEEDISVSFFFFCYRGNVKSMMTMKMK